VVPGRRPRQHRRPYCALYPPNCAFGSLASYVDRLWAEEFAGLDDGAIYDMLDGLLFGGRFDSPVQPPSSLFGEEGERAWTVWGCFSFLTNWGEQFDGSRRSSCARPAARPACCPGRSSAMTGAASLSPRRGVVAAAEGFRAGSRSRSCGCVSQTPNQALQQTRGRVGFLRFTAHSAPARC